MEGSSGGGELGEEVEGFPNEKQTTQSTAHLKVSGGAVVEILSQQYNYLDIC